MRNQISYQNKFFGIKPILDLILELELIHIGYIQDKQYISPPPQPTEEECIICLEDVPLDNGMWVKCIKCTNTICKHCQEQLTHIKCTICREMNSYVPRIF